MSEVLLKQKEADTAILVQEEGGASVEFKSNTTYISEGKTTTYYIPAYLIVLLKKFSQCDLSYGTVDVSMTIVFRFKVDHLNEDEMNAVRSIKIRLNEEEAIGLDGESSELKHVGGYFIFTIRASKTVDFLPTMKNFPFDIHTLKMKLELTSKTVIINGRTCIFRFNCHRNDAAGVMYNFKVNPNPRVDEVDRINELNLAYGKTYCVTPVEHKGKEKYFPVVTIHIPLYREPEFVLISSVLPLFLLNLLCLVVFSLDPTRYYERVAVIVLIVLSLFAFLPTYRSQIRVPTLTCLDAGICATLLVIFLVILESFIASFTPISRTILPVISAVIIFGMNFYILIRYFRYLARRKTLARMPSYEKKSSAQFSDKDWQSVGHVFPNAQELAIVRGAGGPSQSDARIN